MSRGHWLPDRWRCVAIVLTEPSGLTSCSRREYLAGDSEEVGRTWRTVTPVFDRLLYRYRNVVERLVGWLKE